jgi:predicted regulator of Ras-like GTPase activity (Roadblock/LC7/MglB family)
MNEAEAALERVTQVPGVKGSLLISGTDGLVVAERLMDGSSGSISAARRRCSRAAGTSPARK